AQLGDWMALVDDAVLHDYRSEGHQSQAERRFGHKDCRIDKGALVADPDVKTAPAASDTTHYVVATTPPTAIPSVVVVEEPIVDTVQEQRTIGRVKDWVNVREDRPRGYNMAPPTGNVVGPAGAEVIIAETIWNSSNSKYPWYRITSPVHGWIYGQYVSVES